MHRNPPGEQIRFRRSIGHATCDCSGRPTGWGALSFLHTFANIFMYNKEVNPIYVENGYVYRYIHTCIHIYVYMYVHVYITTYIYIYNIHVCVYMYMYIYIYVM